MRVLTAEGSRAADRAAAAAGVDVDRLMEQAGTAVAASAGRAFARALAAGAVVLAGAGANGGDGLVAARVLADRGARVRALVSGGPRRYARRSAAARGALARLAPYGVAVGELGAEALAEVLAAWPGALVIDAISGTGVRGPLRADAAGALAVARARAGAILAVDLPSGVDPDSGAVAAGAVRADRTVAMAFLKPGHLLWPGAGLCGDVEVAPIGLSPFADSDGGPAIEAVGAAEARALLPARPPTLHKGDAGRILVVAGSVGFGGAAVLATLGALASGAGLVTVATTAEVRAALLAAAPAAMALDGDAPLEAPAAAVDAVAAGPGLGRDARAAAKVRALLAAAERLVLDADALVALAADDASAPLWPALRESRAARAGALVLTPHPGEAAALFAVADAGRPVWTPRVEGSPGAGAGAAQGAAASVAVGPSAAAVDAGRLSAARALARAAGGVVLLKGRPTVVAHPDGRLRLNTSGGPALAVGGSGDVLTGLVGGLVAQGLDAFAAAALAAYVHGLAAELAAQGGDRGIGSADVARAVALAYRRLAADGVDGAPAGGEGRR